jgi:hypothetical protein
MADILPPPRGLLGAETFTDEQERPVLRLACDCATYVIEDAAQITGPHEVAFTCDGCESVRWVVITPVEARDG